MLCWRLPYAFSPSSLFPPNSFLITDLLVLKQESISKHDCVPHGHRPSYQNPTYTNLSKNGGPVFLNLYSSPLTPLVFTREGVMFWLKINCSEKIKMTIGNTAHHPNPFSPLILFLIFKGFFNDVFPFDCVGLCCYHFL